MSKRQKYSEEELKFLKRNHRLPRKELHARFVKKFKRPVTVDAIRNLCKARGWLTGCRGHIEYSEQELGFIKEYSHLPRRELHAQFVAKFGREDVTMEDIRTLCVRRGWLTSRGIEYSEDELRYLKRYRKLNRKELHARFVKKFGRPDVTVNSIQCLCARHSWYTDRSITVSDKELEFIKAHKDIARKELVKRFAETFRRTDMNLLKIQIICNRNGWTNSSCSPRGKHAKFSAEELRFIETHKELPRSDLHARFVETFGRSDVSFTAVVALCQRKGWLRGARGGFAAPDFRGRNLYEKGNIPHNVKPAGYERLQQGYVIVCVDTEDDAPKCKTRYVKKHILLWEQTYGPVPEGMVLKCLDGNRQNTDPDNWKPVPRGMLSRLSTERRSYDKAPAELKPTIMATAELEQKIFELKKKEAGMTQRKRAPNKARCEIYLVPAEKAKLQKLAKELNISFSELCRRLLLDKKLPNPARVKDIRDLMGFKADIARLGNMMMFAERRTAHVTNAYIETAHAELEQLRKTIAQKIDQLIITR